MKEDKRIRCRMAACREAPVDDKEWHFYLINDSDAPLDSAVLYHVSTEWGDFRHSQAHLHHRPRPWCAREEYELIHAEKEREV